MSVDNLFWGRPLRYLGTDEHGKPVLKEWPKSEPERRWYESPTTIQTQGETVEGEPDAGKGRRP